ncbi:hypothetical protein Cni_G15070 [Canna indica]|uniref:Trichome birefringence-like N-terminal domain-containing protein n=1 Tax=Canna indica TaxID=4628 RepID=A0AAQ3KG63_9LILI|nr:hypothetical protein Cni_G15070 [Canna indica]
MQVPRRKYPFGPPLEPSLAVAKLAATYMRKGGNFPILVVVLTVFVFGLLVYSEEIKTMAEYSLSRYKAQDDAPRAFPDADRGRPAEHGADVSESAPGQQQSDAEKRAEIAGTNATAAAAAAVNLLETCDLARGEWVFDDVNYPLYREDQCQFLSQQMSCLQNGRRETMYQKWRWQPSGCSLPKFDARLLLEWLRGKRMVFVGDSINRNQWESIVCLLQTVVPPELRSRRVDGPRIIFEVKDYSASIEFYWAPFLVESNSDDPKIHSIAVRVIKADSIEKHAVHWKGADVLVFNTYIWWMNTPWMRVLQPGAKNWTENDKIVRPEAYERVMKTLTNWLDQNMDPNKSSVFFMSMSPLHIK